MIILNQQVYVIVLRDNLPKHTHKITIYRAYGGVSGDSIPQFESSLSMHIIYVLYMYSVKEWKKCCDRSNRPPDISDVHSTPLFAWIICQNTYTIIRIGVWTVSRYSIPQPESSLSTHINVPSKRMNKYCGRSNTPSDIHWRTINTVITQHAMWYHRRMDESVNSVWPF